MWWIWTYRNALIGFDHELILQGVQRRMNDGKVLGLIRQFLNAVVMIDGAWAASEIGSPQGGVISPLLSNIYLDAFDQKMKAQGIRIVRYADDILVFARSHRQAEKYREIAVRVLEEDLKLAVNREKTHITNVRKGVSYLGFVIHSNYIAIHPKRIKRFMTKVSELTPRNHEENVEQQIKKLNRFLRGWISFLQIANCKKLLA